MQDIDLRYYMFDWDDNIVFMPTLIQLQRGGEPVNVTTAEFARIRKDKSYEPLNGDWDQAFSQFRDPPQGKGDFVGDTQKAIADRKFAPSYPAVKRALCDAALFSIVTARGHSSATIRKGVECFIQEALSADDRKRMLGNIQKFNRLAGIEVSDGEALAKYLDLNSYVGVSSPGFLRVFKSEAPESVGASPEEAKTHAVRKFVESTLALGANLHGARIRSRSFGFSDDDTGNYAKMREFMKQELVKEYEHVNFFVYDTSGDKIRVEGLSD